MNNRECELRKYGLNDKLKDIKPGEIRSFQMDEVNPSSLRTRVYDMNRLAGYRKYSSSIDRVTNTIRVISNDKP